MGNALILFVRKPELGKVKTRLAATIGNEKALAIYEELLQHTFEITQSLSFLKFVFYVNAIEHNDLWRAEGFIKRLQSDADLGGKMKDAFAEVIQEGYEKVVIIGSDCFQLTTAIIQQAFELLNKNEIVIGPANDGGYYLLGMKKLYGFIFDNKKWSTETVFGDTVQDLKKYNVSFTTLPILTDVDTEEDWQLSKKD
ncbi:MAG: TIGR04282 family arsenosugar biosynthesis glycosyltransferase [Chitinophagaceae bacterium]